MPHPNGGHEVNFPNEFTHPDYRVISFVADIPLRVDKLISDLDDPALNRFGKLVFIPAEFQLFDEASYANNESGPASHSAYKDRQKEQVWKRLFSDDELERPEEMPMLSPSAQDRR